MKIKDYLASYDILKHHFNEGYKFSIEVYHHDHNGEPYISVEAYPELVRPEHVDGNLIILIHTKENAFTFSAENYNTNLSGDAVVFSSKKDDETHVFINFV